MLSTKNVTLFVIAALLLVACGPQKKEVEEIANVSGRSITKDEFEAHLKFKRIPDDNEKRLEKAFDEYLNRTALAEAIEKEGAFEDRLIQAELESFRKEMLISRYFEKYLRDNVTEQAVANFYNSNAADYEQKKIKVSHVLVRLNRKMTDTERAVKTTKIQEAHSKLKAGTEWNEVVKDYSEDKVSLRKSGDLGWITEGAVDKAFSEKVFSMKKGEISEPFETPFGYHIVKIEEDPKVIKKPLRAVQGDIRHQLRSKAKQAEMDRLTSTLKIEKGKYSVSK